MPWLVHAVAGSEESKGRERQVARGAGLPFDCPSRGGPRRGYGRCPLWLVVVDVGAHLPELADRVASPADLPAEVVDVRRCEQIGPCLTYYNRDIRALRIPQLDSNSVCTPSLGVDALNLVWEYRHTRSILPQTTC